MYSVRLRPHHCIRRDRRRGLLATRLTRVVVRQSALELHVPAVPLRLSSVRLGLGTIPPWVHGVDPVWQQDERHDPAQNSVLPIFGLPRTV
jgi:hypothetical protein